MLLWLFISLSSLSMRRLEKNEDWIIINDLINALE